MREDNKTFSKEYRGDKGIDYLRLSITDKCNMNCMYCTPQQKSGFFPDKQVLSYQDMFKIVRACVALGVKKVRITGGEPLIRKDVPRLIKLLDGVCGLEDLSLTTNGSRLKDLAKPLKRSGLDRINVSIDSLKRDRYKSIAGADLFNKTWDGIMAAIDAGLAPVKLNVVVMSGINNDEVDDFARLTIKYPLSVRFIEFFPTSLRNEEMVQYSINNNEIKKRLGRHYGQVDLACGEKGNGPSENYKLSNALGHIGFISSHSGYFCDQCNRVRVDSAGRMSPCLFAGPICDLGKILCEDRSYEELLNNIRYVFSRKSEYNKLLVERGKVEMSSIGG